MTMFLASTEMTTLSALCYSILVVEILFYFAFRCILVPRANRRTEPLPYRDYPRLDQRQQLLQRILARLQHTCEATQTVYKDAVRAFFLQWFQQKQQPTMATATGLQHEESITVPRKGTKGASPQMLHSVPFLTKATTCSSLESKSSDSGSGAEDQDDSGSDIDTHIAPLNDDETNVWTIPELGKSDMDLLFAWGFFGRETHELSSAERFELEALYPILKQECQGLHFGKASSKPSAINYVPRRPSLEDINPMHRPLLVYLMIWFAKFVVCHAILAVLGFRRIQSQNGLVAWHRPTSSSNMRSHEGKESSTLMPLLFFHGIAPVGLGFYIPMILHLIRDGRAAYLFENAPISYCSLGFEALTEMETVQGVDDILKCTGCVSGPLALVGHSFGSCQLTWLLKSALQKRVKQFVLLDPVTILLSESDVMNNFLYTSEYSRIRLVAASELFIEHYLRRHFSWYNSELWLDDVPDHVSVLVALSEHDEIVNATKVKQQLDIANIGRRLDGKQLDVIYWENFGHADCVTSRSRWSEIKQRMLQQELAMLQAQ